MKIPALIKLLFTICVGATLLNAEEPDPKRVAPSGKYTIGNKPAIDAKELTVEPLGDGKFRLGQITIDASKRQLIFPVTLAEIQNQLEYALVHSAGKAHESLLTTDVHPNHLHIAALLLFAKPGTQLEAEVHWRINGPPQSAKLADLLQISDPHSKPITRTYPALTLAKLAAATELSLLSLINDPASLIAQKLPDNDHRDDIYRFKPNPKLPGKGLPLTLVLTFPGKE